MYFLHQFRYCLILKRKQVGPLVLSLFPSYSPSVQLIQKKQSLGTGVKGSQATEVQPKMISMDYWGEERDGVMGRS